MNRKITSIALMLLAVLLVGQTIAFGQTTINQTTLSTAITDTGTTTLVTLASLGSGSTAVVPTNILFMDGEADTVIATPSTSTSLSGTTVRVTRHTLATPGQTHAANTYVYYGPSQAFVSGRAGVQFYQGSCTSSQYQYLPVIDVINTTIGQCANSTWHWLRLNTQTTYTHAYTPITNANYTALPTDEIIGYTSLQGGKTVTLPSAVGLAGKTFVIEDESGSAGTGTATITINGLNGGNTTGTITTGYGNVIVRSNGTIWIKG